MKGLFLLIVSVVFFLGTSAQEPVKIYNPLADAKSEVASAILRARESGKHVFIQVGGNWCKWCIRFHNFVHEDAKLDSLLKANYEVVLVNFSKENENRGVLARLDYPQRFGYPVFVILDAKGNRIHTQDSGFLEDGAGYSHEKVERLFLMWSADAIHKTMEKYKE
jgi:thioredoxin-related protein